MNFAYLDDQNTLYFTPLNGQENNVFTVQAMDGARYIFTEQNDTNFNETVSGVHVGNDLYLNFRSSQAPSSIVVKDFYQFNTSIYGLTQGGEYRMYLPSDSASAQGGVSFVSVELGMQQDQAEADSFKVIQQAVTFQHLDTLSESLNPTVGSPVEQVKPLHLMASPEPAAAPFVTQPVINGIYDQVGSKQGALITGSVTDDKMPLLMGVGQPNSTLDILQNGEKIGTVQVDAQGNWSFLTDVPYDESGQLFFVRDTATGATSNNFVFIIDTVAPKRAEIINATDDHSGATKVIASAGYTNDNTPTLSGKAEENCMVAIYNGKQLIGTTYTDQLGNWSFTPVFLIPDNFYSFNAVAIDFSGNTGLASTKYSFTVDTLAPNQPEIIQVIDNVGAVTGPVRNGGGTDDTTPTFNGLAEPGSRVAIYGNGQKLGEVRADASGNWSFTPDSPLDKGTYVFTATATDKTENQSQASAPWSLNIVLDAPAMPIVESVYDDHGPIKYEINSGDITDDATPTIKGSADANTIVVIYDNGEEIGSVPTDENGHWSFTPPTSLTDGDHSLTFVAVNEAGNSSDVSAPWIIVVDTEAPDLPSISSVYDDAGVKTGELAFGAITDDTTPTLSGNAEAGSTVAIFDNGQKLGETRADANGNWSFTPATPLIEGEHSFTVQATDIAGNASDLSEAWDVVIDTTAPEQPGIDGQGPGISGIIDDQGAVQGPIENGGVTDDTTPTINGTGEPGDTIIVLDKGEKIGETTVDEDGNWKFTPETELGDGDHEITVVIQDPAGNQSNPSDPWEFTVDTQAPDAPSIGSVYDDAGVKTGELAFGAITDDNTPTLSGNAEAGSTVAIFDNGQKLGETRADANGNWSFTPATPLIEGEHSFTVQATDIAGNAWPSDLSEAWDVVIDTTAPEQPGIDGQGPGISGIIDDQGAVQGPIENGGVTDDTTPTINGTGEPGDTIIVLDKGEKIGETTVDEDGNWKFTPETELGDGDHEITVVIQDPAGNQSNPSDAWEFTVDTQAPEAPSIGSVYDDAGVKTGELAFGAITDDTTPTLSGNAEAGSTVAI
ncbi:Ig-like domain-containing protein [Pseudomonas zeae]|uniref:Ig-like domain repeat protein n=1 Tax=Pseudomonas zeae TaxID=2745510 RepID=A0A9E6NNF2_9PSED|nr:Ig-like domain-containing protein [Pseudomonas zeae]QXI11250.1 Ig-like domain repeat protein [Pseudomonas zeae]